MTSGQHWFFHDWKLVKKEVYVWERGLPTTLFYWTCDCGATKTTEETGKWS